MRFFIIVSIIVIAAVSVLVWPHIDIIVSGLFYRPDQGFFLSDMPAFDAFHVVAHAGSRILALAFLLLTIVAACQRRPVGGLSSKAWMFLFLGLLLGPGLVANGILKDHWGRARPREIVEFGGQSHFSAAFKISDQCDRNCSFVSGDGSFGFYLPIFAYVVPLPRSRRMFWSGMGLGTLFALARLAVGAHFFSDSLYAALFMQAIIAGLHAAMFGWKKTQNYWRLWFYLPRKSTG